MSYTIPTSVQTKAEAVLAVASAIADEDMGARYDGTVNTSLDVLADAMAAQDVSVPQTNAGAILALAQYIGGGGGGSTVELTIYEVYNDQPLSTAYFTAEDSSGNQLTVTPHIEERRVYFTVEAAAGSIVVLKTIENSGYNFDPQSSVYTLDDDSDIAGLILSAHDDEIKFVVVSSAEFPDQGFILTFSMLQ